MLPAALASPAHATPSASEQKIIERLIQRIAKKGTMLFIRNDKEYDAAEAAKHLQAKFDHFKERIVTAEDFIELCATRSEVTGQPYKVKLAGGTLRNASDFMNDELRHVRQEMRRTG
jgi:hypothetical protein